MALSKVDKNLQIKDVYDCASDLFQEFEKIIAITGIDDVSALINKVKNVLELLEESVKEIEYLDKEYSDLKTKCSRLSLDKLLKEEENKNLKQTFEELEESWQQETLNLKSLVDMLTKENKILERNLAQKKEMEPEVDNAYKAIIEEQRNLILKLKSNIKQKDSRFARDQAYIEVLNAEVSRLTELNNSLHLRYEEAQRIVSEMRQEERESDEKFSCLIGKLETLAENVFDLRENYEFEMQNIMDICKPLREGHYANMQRFLLIQQENQLMNQEVNKLKLELELLKIKLDEYFKNLILDHTRKQNRKCTQSHGDLDLLSWLFLGLAGDDSPACILRNKRMYSS